MAHPGRAVRFWYALICSLLAGAARGVILTSPTLQRLMPSIGNGYVATHPIVGAGGGVTAAYIGNSIYMAGVYNGVSKNRSTWGTNRQQSHRASIPDWVTELNTSATCAGGAAQRLGGFGLDTRRAVVTKAWAACGADLRVEELHFAHQTRRNLLVRTRRRHCPPRPPFPPYARWLGQGLLLAATP